MSNMVLAVSSARNAGLGDDFAAVTGADALYGNPAAVNATDDKFTLEFNAAGQFWNNMLVNDDISESQKDELLDSINDSGFVVSGDSSLGGKLIIGPITGFADVKMEGLVRASNDVAELVLKGTTIDEGTTYVFDGSRGAGAVYGDIGANISLEAPEEIADAVNSDKVYIGMSYHYLTGAVVKGSGDGSITIDYDNNVVINGDGQLRTYYTEGDELNNTGASGQAFDLGIYADIDETYSVGLSVLNLAGSLESSQGKYSSYKVEYNQETDELEVVEDIVDADMTEDLVYKLPLVIKAGGKMHISDYSLELYANYTNTRYNDKIFAETIVDHRVSAAAEYKGIDWLPLRLGTNYSTLQNDFDISAGMGLDLGPFEMDLGISDVRGLFYKSKGVSAGLNCRIEF